MKDYIDISTGLFEHHKTLELMRCLGKEKFIHIIVLWGWLNKHNMENGVLVGMNDRDIEHVAKWDGEAGKFFEALVNTGWLVLNIKGNFVLHGINSASLENF